MDSKAWHIQGVNTQIQELGGQVGIRLFNRVNVPHLIYSERREKTYSAPIMLPAFISVHPAEDILTEIGMEKDRTEVVVKVTREALLKGGLVDYNWEIKVTTDDIIVINGVTYAITKITPYILYNNHQIYAFGCYRG